MWCGGGSPGALSIPLDRGSETAKDDDFSSHPVSFTSLCSAASHFKNKTNPLPPPSFFPHICEDGEKDYSNCSSSHFSLGRK